MPDSAVFSFPAALQPQQTQSVADAQLLELAKSRGAADPTIFDEHAPYFWRAEISSNRLDAYYTQMQPSTLRNFADAAQQGVSFLNSHNSRELGLGYSLTGEFIGAQQNGISRVVADFYTIPGIQLGSVSTDNFIKGVRSGLIRDVSVGFHGGQYICSICGRDMMVDYQCNHYPGLVYEVKDASGYPTAVADKLCIAAIENAQLSEVSAVYDGATPSAMISRATEAARDGRLTERQINLLEQQYRMRLPEKRAIVQLPVIPSGTITISTTGTSLTTGTIFNRGDSTHTPLIASGTNNATDNDIQHPDTEASTGDKAIEAGVMETEKDETTMTIDEKQHEAVVTERDALKTERDELNLQVRALGDENARLKPIVDEITTLRNRVLELEPKARDGEMYRENLITETLAEGVRAFGETFDADAYKALLNGVSLDIVKRMNADWRKVGDQLFEGGRKTVDGNAEPKTSDATNAEKQHSIAYAG